MCKACIIVPINDLPPDLKDILDIKYLPGIHYYYASTKVSITTMQAPHVHPSTYYCIPTVDHFFSLPKETRSSHHLVLKEVIFLTIIIIINVLYSYVAQNAVEVTEEKAQ